MQNNLMENLNPEQLKAVLHKEGPLLIVAGAGTGKTTVITQKIAYIIEQTLAKSDEILALTFTEKAAGEMEERVDRLLPYGYLDLWISTFHSFAERILKSHGLEIGLPSEFKLLNEFEQWALIQKNFDRFNLNYYRPLGNPTKFISALLKHFSRLKDEDINPSAYLRYASELKENLDSMLSGAKSKKGKGRGNFQFSISNFQTSKEGIDKEIAEQEVERINEVANAYHMYQQLLLENSALDFGDLINYTLKLFRERPYLLKKYREQFKYILVDEFQDTNWSQYELVKLLSEPRNNLIAVADDDQSIYRFRGASMSNILQFKKDYPKTEQVILVKNYRSKQNILDLAYEFIKLNNPNRLEWQLALPVILNEAKRSEESRSKRAPRSFVAGAPQDDKKLNKKLIAQNKGEGEIEVLAAEDLNGEVLAVIKKINQLKTANKESGWDDFAILVRANDTAKEFCSALGVAGLPYQFLASRGLYSKPVILDVIAYLKLLDDYHESRAMYRLLNLSVFKFTYLELVELNNLAYRKSWSLFETMRETDHLDFNPETKKKIVQVLMLISKHTALVREKAAGEIVLAFLNDSGYLKQIADLPEEKSREQLSFLNQFMKRVKEFESASDDKSVKAFLAEYSLEVDSGEEGSLAPDPDAGPEAIKISTVHGAKGLEFKYVFVVSLVDRRFPTDERKEQIEVPAALIKEILPEGDIHLEEERRLFYVAMTRAKTGLYFSWAPDYGGTRKKKPSRFLVECGLVDATSSVILTPHNNAGEESIKGLSTTNYRSFASAQDDKGGRGSDDNDKKQFKQPEFRMPAYLSYTQLAAFSKCPYQYRFAHILKVPLRGKGVFSFGKTMHATLQKLYELLDERRGLGQTPLDLYADQKKAVVNDDKNLTGRATLFAGAGKQPDDNPTVSLEEIIKLYEASWQDDWFESKKQKIEYRQKGKEILKVYYEKHKDAWPEVKATEQGFKLKIASNGAYYTVQGRIDRIDCENGQLKLIDYKTGAPKDKLTFEEKEQLFIYQLAVPSLYHEEVGSLVFYYLDDNTEVEFLGTSEELSKMKEKIITTIEAIKKGEFPPKPSMLCKWCDFFDICEYRQN
jgi:DNA helicase-2/ATP-dependent DNA helicase PcrA